MRINQEQQGDVNISSMFIGDRLPSGALINSSKRVVDVHPYVLMTEWMQTVHPPSSFFWFRKFSLPTTCEQCGSFPLNSSRLLLPVSSVELFCFFFLMGLAGNTYTHAFSTKILFPASDTFGIINPSWFVWFRFSSSTLCNLKTLALSDPTAWEVSESCLIIEIYIIYWEPCVACSFS